MNIEIRKINSSAQIEPKLINVAYLWINNWDDYHFKTQFSLSVCDEQGKVHDIGSLKIGYAGQIAGWTEQKLLPNQEKLPEGFFSLGLDVDYYNNLKSVLSPKLSTSVLKALRDVAHDKEILNAAENEEVFKYSLLRGVSLSAITSQYRRVLNGNAVLTDFNFGYSNKTSDPQASFRLTFKVTPQSKPSSNLHVLIGRNGVGKTTLLNNMIKSAIQSDTLNETNGFFEIHGAHHAERPITDNYFTSITSVSFSAFDPFPPQEKSSRFDGIGYFYIGLKKAGDTNFAIKNADELTKDFQESLEICFRTPNKTQRWIKAITTLESDVNFADMQLTSLAEELPLDLDWAAAKLYSKMSSGHRIILLTMTKLVETIEEKTLVLIDEPESHLHPPLLSAFTRALSELLIDRNAVAIIATHSPVVLQEIPASCIWKLRRTNQQSSADRPEIETFGENVGVLTDEVFGLEVSESGFLRLLKESVAEGKSYEEILSDYQNKLGFEGRAILRALVSARKPQKEPK